MSLTPRANKRYRANRRNGHDSRKTLKGNDGALVRLIVPRDRE